MRLLFYVLLSLLLTPVYLVGFFFYMVPIVLVRGRVSGTTYEPFNARLLYHLMGVRPDPAALQLARGLAATNRGTMNLLLRPMVWVSRVTGHVPASLAYPSTRPTPMTGLVAVRCEFFDKAMLDHVSAGDQVVILGAGWDTRAYGLLQGKGTTVFEVDAPATQAVKRQAVVNTGLDASHVTFVSCDFNRQSWLDALTEHGFDVSTRTFILWEGVTMYLEEHAIQSTLRAVSSLPSGSRIAFDFFSREWLEDTVPGRSARWGIVLIYGEAFTFGFPVTPDFSGRLRRCLEPCGLDLEDDWPIGDEGGRTLPVGGLALAVKP